jgi:outer membrane protein assembly factor BamB
MAKTGFARWLLVSIVMLLVWAPAAAWADWTTYRGDAARSGVDSSSVGSLPFGSAWTSPSLGGSIYGEPLVHDGMVIVATEANQVIALSEASGQVVWQASAGTPVPAGQLSCGDISPTVGITSTPVIDPASDRVFVVADTVNGASIQHKLFAFNLSDGSGVAGFPVDVEPPGDVPADQLQRPALALDNGMIVVGYGGNDGDCGTYHGWLLAVPSAGGPARTFEVEPNAGEGAIWGAGNGPAVDSFGSVWVATGNGASGSSYGYQESVLRLDPSMNLLDHWAPSNWQSLDASDKDLGSSEPLLLPNGLVFQIGKEGVGYLLSVSRLGGTGASPAFTAPVCGGSFGGAVYTAGTIYVACSDGTRALALNPTAPSFSAAATWNVPSTAIGPPIFAGGLVWATDWSHGTLFGLDPHTGQAVVTQATPAMEHFSTPAASDGRLFLATGDTVEAYTIANPAPAPLGSTPPAPPPPRCVLKLRSPRVKLHHPRRRKHGPPVYGTVSLIAWCSQAAQVTLNGIVTERLGRKPRHRKARIRIFRLAPVRATLVPPVARMLRLRLAPALMRALERRVLASGAFTLTAAGAGGTTRARTHHRLRL